MFQNYTVSSTNNVSNAVSCNTVYDAKLILKAISQHTCRHNLTTGCTKTLVRNNHLHCADTIHTITKRFFCGHPQNFDTGRRKSGLSFTSLRKVCLLQHTYIRNSQSLSGFNKGPSTEYYLACGVHHNSIGQKINVWTQFHYTLMYCTPFSVPIFTKLTTARQRSSITNFIRNGQKIYK